MVAPSVTLLLVVSGFLTPHGIGLVAGAAPPTFIAAPPVLAFLAQETGPSGIASLSAGGFGHAAPADLLRDDVATRSVASSRPRESSFPLEVVHGLMGRSSYDVYLNLVRDRIERLQQARRALDG